MIKIAVRDGFITIRDDDNGVHIIVSSHIVPCTEIVAKDSGRPGIIGPDITINLSKQLENIIDEQVERAKDAIS